MDLAEQLLVGAAASLLPAEGELVVPGLRSRVEVRRDRWGAHYLRADSLDDLWFAQGFVAGSERCFQIDLALRAANGRLSELFGPSTLDDDRFVRTVGLHRAGRRYVEVWSDASRTIVQRFVDGVLAWVAATPTPPVEYSLLDTKPDLPNDLASWASCWAYLA